MESHLPDPTEGPDHPSVIPDELMVHVVLVKRGEDLVFEHVAISQTLFQQSPASATLQIFQQIGKKFSQEEQLILQQAISTYSGIIKTNNLNQIYVYIVITNTVTEADGEEKVTLCAPMIFLKKPCKSVNEQRNFSEYLMKRIQEDESKFKHLITMVNEVVRKYGDSMECVEVKKESDIGQNCSICLKEYTVGSQAIRLPCDHSFCSRCILLWLSRNGSCPLCRHQLILKSPLNPVSQRQRCKLFIQS